MYFTPEGIRKVIRAVLSSFGNRWMVVVSPTETSHELFSEFATFSFGDVTFYRKWPGLATFALPVSHEDRRLFQVVEWTMQTPEPTRFSCDEANLETPDNEARSVNTAPSTSYRQVMAL